MMKKNKPINMATGGLMNMPPFIKKSEEEKEKGITPYDVNTPKEARQGLPTRLLSPSRTRFTVGGGADASKFVFLGSPTNSLGIGTANPRARLDVEGRIKMTSCSENVRPVDISSNNADIDLDRGQSFTLTVDSEVRQFTLLNPPDDATSFTIKILQNDTGYSVGINTFKDASGNDINVYWPAGGVVPIVTQDGNKTDIYSFKTFDSGASLYGVVGGQNFVA